MEEEVRKLLEGAEQTDKPVCVYAQAGRRMLSTGKGGEGMSYRRS